MLDVFDHPSDEPFRPDRSVSGKLTVAMEAVEVVNGAPAAVDDNGGFVVCERPDFAPPWSVGGDHEDLCRGTDRPPHRGAVDRDPHRFTLDRKSTLKLHHGETSYAVFCLTKKK